MDVELLNTALWVVSTVCCVGVAGLVVERGVDAIFRCAGGEDSASLGGCAGVVSVLIERGAGVNAWCRLRGSPAPRCY